MNSAKSLQLIKPHASLLPSSRTTIYLVSKNIHLPKCKFSSFRLRLNFVIHEWRLFFFSAFFYRFELLKQFQSCFKQDKLQPSAFRPFNCCSSYLEMALIAIESAIVFNCWRGKSAFAHSTHCNSCNLLNISNMFTKAVIKRNELVLIKI